MGSGGYFKQKFLISLLLILSSGFARGDFTSQLKVSSKKNFQEAIDKSFMSLDDWLADQNNMDFDLMCFGESHDNYFRELMATKILSQLKISVLAIEDQQEKADQLVTGYADQNMQGLLVTGVPFDRVIESYYATNGFNPIVGVEVNQQQKLEITLSKLEEINSGGGMDSPSRDSAIAVNLAKILQSHHRVLSLYGAKHCSYFEDGLGFDTPFLRQLSDFYGDEKKLIAVHVSREGEDDLLRTYLESFGLLQKEGDWVLANTRAIDPKVYNYRMDIYKVLQSYDAIYFPKN